MGKTPALRKRGSQNQGNRRPGGAPGEGGTHAEPSGRPGSYPRMHEWPSPDRGQGDAVPASLREHREITTKWQSHQPAEAAEAANRSLCPKDTQKKPRHHRRRGRRPEGAGPHLCGAAEKREGRLGRSGSPHSPEKRGTSAGSTGVQGAPSTSSCDKERTEGWRPRRPPKGPAQARSLADTHLGLQRRDADPRGVGDITGGH